MLVSQSIAGKKLLDKMSRDGLITCSSSWLIKLEVSHSRSQSFTNLFLNVDLKFELFTQCKYIMNNIHSSQIFAGPPIDASIQMCPGNELLISGASSSY